MGLFTKTTTKAVAYIKTIVDCITITLRYYNNIKYLFGITDSVKVTDDIFIQIPEKTVRKRIGNLAKIKRCLDNGWIPVSARKDRTVVLVNKELGIKIVQNNFGIVLENFTQLIDKVSKVAEEKENVIDVGGFFGETAVMFAKKGYKKVYVFEPVCANMQYILENIEINGLKNRIVPINKAVADRDSTVTIVSSEPPLTPGFGLKNTGKARYKIEVEAVSWNTLLKDIKRGKYGKVSVLKADCEGCEKYLANVPKHLLQAVPVWIVETHTKDVYSKVVEKFTEAGFEQIYNKHMGADVKLIILKVKKNVAEYVSS